MSRVAAIALHTVNNHHANARKTLREEINEAEMWLSRFATTTVDDEDRDAFETYRARLTRMYNALRELDR